MGCAAGVQSETVPAEESGASVQLETVPAEDRQISIQGWGSFPNGDICCGPGSYYLEDKSITVYRRDITTLKDAQWIVQKESKKYPDNPVVAFQLSDPWAPDRCVDGKEDRYVKTGHFLVFHRKKFLQQPLDDHSPDLKTGIFKDHNDHPEPKKYGSPVFFRLETVPADENDASVQLETVPAEDRQINIQGWGSFPNGDICCGPGSYYLEDKSITVYRRDITTLEDAQRVVQEESKKDPDNPVVAFQLSDPWAPDRCVDGKEDRYVKTGHFLVFHRKRFLQQPLDDHSPDLETGIFKDHNDHPEPKKYGSPVFFRRDVAAN